MPQNSQSDFASQDILKKYQIVTAKEKWFLQTWFICLLFAFWFFIFPGIAGIVLLTIRIIRNINRNKNISALQTELYSMTHEKTVLTKKVEELQNQLTSFGANNYFEAKQKLNYLHASYSNMKAAFDSENQQNNETISKLKNEIISLQEQYDKLSRQTLTQEKKLRRSKELYQSVSYTIDNFINLPLQYSDCKLSSIDFSDYEFIAPSVMLKLHCMDIKDLRKVYKENEKQINTVLEQYSSRYTTKANKTIYQLMVIALRAELQNILYDLKYEKLDTSVEKVRNMTAKYLKLAGEGNQSIAGTITKFIGEIEYLFINAVKIEYNYYVKKEQARQEQMALRQQMREEAEERKQLEQQRKKVEQEELKYHTEIAKTTEALSLATDTKQIEALKRKILELQGQLSDVAVKKDEISKLQNGKAGNVYVISNLGSFGENVFKIGMTRRLNPQERIDELGSASVPFRFDVHSFIFSDDAVGLENKLHTILNDKRVNKVNLRKEFFYSSLDELESLVSQIDPTAEFNKTMLAEEFHQSQSADTPYTADYNADFDEDDE